MRAFTRSKLWRRLRYRLAVAGLCLAYLLAALDVPLPAFVHKDSSQPFPCQDHPCGCQTAEQCWSHCCCFSPEERWAWARAHNVEPPAYAEKPAPKPVENSADQGWNTVKLRDREQQKTKPASESCCGKRLPHRACCQSSSDRPAEQAKAGSGGMRWGSVLAAWQCQGLQTVWVSVGAVLPVSPPAAWVPDNPPPSLVRLSDQHACILPATPPAPPPRRLPV